MYILPMGIIDDDATDHGSGDALEKHVDGEDTRGDGKDTTLTIHVAPTRKERQQDTYKIRNKQGTHLCSAGVS